MQTDRYQENHKGHYHPKLPWASRYHFSWGSPPNDAYEITFEERQWNPQLEKDNYWTTGQIRGPRVAQQARQPGSCWGSGEYWKRRHGCYHPRHMCCNQSRSSSETQRCCRIPQSWQNNPGKEPRQILVKFATRNVRERVYRAKSALKSVNQNTEEGKPKIYINEDLTKFKAGLAREARSIKNAGLISETWTIYGKVMIKGNFGHVKIITKYADLLAYKQTAGRDGTAETGEQSTMGVA